RRGRPRRHRLRRDRHLRARPRPRHGRATLGHHPPRSRHLNRSERRPMTERQLPTVDDLRARQGAMLADLEALVATESPSTDVPSLTHCAEVVAAMGERLLGVAPETVTVGDWPHLRWRFGTPRVLLLGHFDTV